MFEGTLTALATPFKDGKVDEDALRRHIRFQLENGVDGLVPCGTTGEAATLNGEEFEQVVSITVEEAKGKVPVVAGTGTNNTAAVIKNTARAKELGVDGALVVTPYYNKPTQEGLYAHFRAVVDAVDLPIVLYNVPGRTSVNMLPSTVARLSELDRIAAIKEASGSIPQISEIIRTCSDRLNVLSGDDALTFSILCLGGKGVISTTGNVIPGPFSEMVRETRKGDIEKGRKLHHQYTDLFDAMFYETNPQPVKTALALMGRFAEEFRLPMREMHPDNKKRLAEVLKRHGLVT